MRVRDPRALNAAVDRACREGGLTKQGIAAAAGIHPSMLSHLLHARRTRLRKDLAENLARVLWCDPKTLFSERGPDAPTTGELSSPNWPIVAPAASITNTYGRHHRKGSE